VAAAATFSLGTVAVQPDRPPTVAYAPAVHVAEHRTSSKKPWWKAPAPAPAPQGEPVRSWTIEQAIFPAAPEVNARDELYEKIGDRLKRDLSLRRAPGLRIVGNPAFVRIEELGREVHQDRDPKLGELVSVRYTVELTPQGWAELDREQRADRAGNRMELAGRGLGLLTLLLGAVAAYIRLDDWTKGYYSGRLFLAAALLTIFGGTALCAL
jgi:hypothetical protein